MPHWLAHPDDDGPSPTGRPLLIVGDIRGDSRALEAILDEVADVELCGVVAVGDHCLGGPDPFRVWRRLNALGATMVRGLTDLALGALSVDGLTPSDEAQEERLEGFLATRDALGDIICRRLAELPTTAVVSLDDRSGVMALAGTPRDEHRILRADMDDDLFAEETACVAEDVLVVGGPTGWVRQAPQLLAVGAGSVSRNRARTEMGGRTAHAVLLQSYRDGQVRAFAKDIIVPSGQSGGRLRRNAG
jgi:hypothetical protein